MSSSAARAPVGKGPQRWSLPALREGIDNIVHARTGGLLVIGDTDELAFLFSGGIRLDIDYTPALVDPAAKMDGALSR